MHPLRQPSTLCLPSLGSTLPWKLTGAEDSGALQIRMMIIWFMHHVCYVLWYLAPEVTCRCRNIITQITGEILTLAILIMQRIANASKDADDNKYGNDTNTEAADLQSCQC